MEAILDKSGRIVIPKKIRDDLGLNPGIVLEIEEQKDKLVLKPSKSETPLQNKDGILIFTGSPTNNISGAVKLHRENRLQSRARWSKK